MRIAVIHGRRALRHAVLLLAAGIAGSCGGGRDVTGPPDDPGPDDVASVEVSPPTLDLVVGQSSQLSATPRAGDGGALSDRAVAWASDDEAIATVDASGMVTAVAPGEVEISATSEGKRGSSTVTVAPPTGTIRTWKGGAGGNPGDWAAAANWDPQGKPVALDTARVPAAANAAVLTEAVQVAQLAVRGGRIRTAGHRLVVRSTSAASATAFRSR